MFDNKVQIEDEEEEGKDENEAKDEVLPSSPSIRELLAAKGETPTRRRLREQVKKTIGEGMHQNSCVAIVEPVGAAKSCSDFP
jgi:hypothetical protein